MVSADLGFAMHKGACPMIEWRDIPDAELIRMLREAAAAWFNNDQLLLLEELIMRVSRRRL